MTLIDCPYYKEFTSSIPAGTSHHNCWSESGWDDYPCNCKVPGHTKPLCNPKTNGWKDGVFIAKVDKSKLNKALRAYAFLQSLIPENIVKRLDAIEKALFKKGE